MPGSSRCFRGSRLRHVDREEHRAARRIGERNRRDRRLAGSERRRAGHGCAGRIDEGGGDRGASRERVGREDDLQLRYVQSCRTAQQERIGTGTDGARVGLQST